MTGLPPPKGTGILATRSLSFRYGQNDDLIVNGLSVSFPSGKVTAITGASGSGKSTLLYLLALMLRASSGAVLWGSREISTLSDGARSQLRAARMGFIFQDAMLDPSRTVIDNVCESALFAGMPRKEQRRQAEDLLTRFGVGHRIDHLPGEISGGQAQRVALCRALLTNPRVVFGDEPTGNLDTSSAAIVWESLVEHAAKGATVIIATHDRELARQADFHLNLDSAIQ